MKFNSKLHEELFNDFTFISKTEESLNIDIKDLQVDIDRRLQKAKGVLYDEEDEPSIIVPFFMAVGLFITLILVL